MRKLFVVLLLMAANAFGQNAPIAIRAGTMIDGRGGVSRNTTIVVENGKIKSIGPSTQTNFVSLESK
jgi:imidazolonepropionase-like amidohydrolase